MLIKHWRRRRGSVLGLSHTFPFTKSLNRFRESCFDRFGKGVLDRLGKSSSNRLGKGVPDRCLNCSFLLTNWRFAPVICRSFPDRCSPVLSFDLTFLHFSFNHGDVHHFPGCFAVASLCFQVFFKEDHQGHRELGRFQLFHHFKAFINKPVPKDKVQVLKINFL